MSSPDTQKHDVGSYYDEIPYENLSYPNMQPPHVRAIATLFGLNPPEMRKARVLEIGCAGGGNLLPLAHAYPQAQFFGIDISQKQIAEANRNKKLLKLDNIEFRQQDLLLFDMEANKGRFDYIVAHGVFSWVPEPVREKLLAVCNACLSPGGVAVISFNTLPGWNAVRSLREMILYHTEPFSTALEKVQHGRFLADFIGELIPKTNFVHRAVFDELRPFLAQGGDAYVSHEYLENTNQPFYFHEFMRQARAHGLEYVGDSDLGMMYYAALTPEAVNLLTQLKGHVVDTVSHEQYMDFITNRRFRMTILCKSDQKINRELRNEQIMDYSLSLMPGFAASGHDPKQNITFKNNVCGFITEDEISGVLFLELLAAEKPLAAEALVERVRKKLGLQQPDTVRKVLVEKGMSFALRNILMICAKSADVSAA